MEIKIFKCKSCGGMRSADGKDIVDLAQENASLKAELYQLQRQVADDIAHNYYGTHWRREIGIDGGYMGIYDGIVAVRCPDCLEEFPRGSEPWALELFEKYKEAVK